MLGVCCVWLNIAAPHCEGQPVEAKHTLSPAKQSIRAKMERIRELRQQRQDAHEQLGESSHAPSAYADTAAARNPFEHEQEEHKRTADVAAGVRTLPRSRMRASTSPSPTHPPAISLLLTSLGLPHGISQARTPTAIGMAVARRTLQHGSVRRRRHSRPSPSSSRVRRSWSATTTATSSTPPQWTSPTWSWAWHSAWAWAQGSYG